MRPRPTFADYLAIAIGPVLIGLLVGSLAFFLLELFYQGAFGGRLRFIMAMFVVGAVGVARISIEGGREYSVIYAVPLGLVTVFAAWWLVEFQGPLQQGSLLISTALIALIWWSTDRLVWDCTVIDENEAGSGEGLLQTAGLDADRSAPSGGEPHGAAADERATDLVVDGVTTTNAPPPPTGIWNRFMEYRRRPHAPGVWVLYFSLAALPIFGVGQLFLPAGDLAGRRFVFQLLVVYVSAGLGLLLVTSLLSMRRYLRHRRIEMSSQITSRWVALGAAFIAGVLIFAVALPRRNPEYSISQLEFFARTPSDRQSSRWSVGRDALEQQQADRKVRREDGQEEPGPNGNPGSQQDDRARQTSQGEADSDRQQPQQNSGSQQQQQQQQQQPSQSSQQQDSEQAEASNGSDDASRPPDRQSGGTDDRAEQSEDGQSQDAQSEQDDAGRSEDGRSGDEQPSRSGRPRPRESEDQEGRDGRRQSSSRDRAQQQQDPSDREAETETETEAEEGAQSGGGRSGSWGSRIASRLSPPRLLSTSSLGSVLTFIYWLIFVLLAAFFCWKFRAELLAAFRAFCDGLRSLWQRLFGARPSSEIALAAPIVPLPRRRSFSEFHDPFLAGNAEQQSVDELIKYSFEAFEAWGNDHGCPRAPEQTVHEFAQRVAARSKAFSDDALRLADLVSWSAYAREMVPRSSLQQLREVWAKMRNMA